MKQMFIPFLCCLALLASCGEANQTVGYYKTHDTAREEKLAECRNKPGEWDATPNCMNAETATRQLMDEVQAEAAAVAKPYQDQIAQLWENCKVTDYTKYRECQPETSKQATALDREARDAVNQIMQRRQNLIAQISRN